MTIQEIVKSLIEKESRIKIMEEKLEEIKAKMQELESKKRYKNQ